MDELYARYPSLHVHRFLIRSMSFAAAYQVGLTFLTSHMRRAVAACTSPELFFGRPQPGMADTAAFNRTNDWDPLGIAMDSAMESLNMELAGAHV